MFRCEICKKEFKSASGLAGHRQWAHRAGQTASTSSSLVASNNHLKQLAAQAAPALAKGLAISPSGLAERQAEDVAIKAMRGCYQSGRESMGWEVVANNNVIVTCLKIGAGVAGLALVAHLIWPNWWEKVDYKAVVLGAGVGGVTYATTSGRQWKLGSDKDISPLKLLGAVLR